MTSRSTRETKAYGTPIQPAIRTGTPANRNKVGEADAVTRRRMLDRRLSERNPAPPARARRQPADGGNTTGVSPNAYRLLRDRGKQIDKDVADRDK